VIVRLPNAMDLELGHPRRSLPGEQCRDHESATLGSLHQGC
jgi:hypothetical protein